MSDVKLRECPFCGSSTPATKTILPTLLHKSDCYMITHQTEAWNRRAPSEVEQERLLAEKGLRLKWEIDASRLLAETEHQRTRIVDLTAERDALLAENKWHPVSEPPDDDRVVWCHGTMPPDERGFYQDGRWHYFDDDGSPMAWNNYLPTHWREMPKFKENV